MHGPIDALPSPGNALHRVVFGQPSLPKTEEETTALPAQKVRVDRAGAAELTGQRLPLAARAQDINDGGKHLPGGHWRATRAGLAAILAPFWATNNGHKWFYFGPKRIRNGP